jgi:hypothetical protein
MHPTEQAPLRVLESANMPAVLIELGYLSNPEQEKSAGRRRLSRRVCAGVDGRRRPFPRIAAERDVALMSKRVAGNHCNRHRPVWRYSCCCSSACRAGTAASRELPRPAQPPLLPLRRRQAPPGRKIKAHLYYVADDGMRLTRVERDVPYGEGAVEQAREIVSAQVAAVVDPLVSAVPAGTTVRALFVTEQGEAFVDLSKEVVSAHPGGTMNELLTVYTIVNAITENLPAVTSVQLLVDGKEVETLAGHVDLRPSADEEPELFARREGGGEN